MKRTIRAVPAGVAWPTVSVTQTRWTPSRTASPYRRRIVSGCARSVSSVTYITGRPASTAKRIASADWRTRNSSSHPSAYWRIGDEPMNTQASAATPVRSAISTIGSMSRITVRAAQFGVIDSLASAISRHSASTSAAARGPAPGSPTSAVSMPSASIR
jgi:hypothetical protein